MKMEEAITAHLDADQVHMPPMHEIMSCMQSITSSVHG